MRPPERKVLLEGAAVGASVIAALALFLRGMPSPADYDEGVYLASIDALRHGQQLGSQIFTPQPPAFYELLRVGDAVFGNSLHGVRGIVVFCAVVSVVAAWALVRSLAGPAAGVGAAALLAVCAPLPTFSSRISADLPAYAIGLVGLAVAARARAAPSLLVLAGALVAVSVLVKVSALTVLVPLLAIVVVRARAGRAVAWLGLGLALPFVVLVATSFSRLHGLWNGAVAYHEAAQGGGPSTSDNASRVLHFFDARTPSSWLVLVALLVVAAGRVERRRLAPLWAWAVVGAGFLVWHRPLHDNHMVLLAFVLAIPAGGTLGMALQRRRGWQLALMGSLVGLVLVAAYAQEWRRLGRNQAAEPQAIVWASQRLAGTTQPGQLVLADQPYAAFLARRQVPGELVDTATLRFESGYLTTARVLRVLSDRHVAAVAAVRAIRDHPDLMRALARTFPHRYDLGSEATVFSRAPFSPPRRSR